MEIRLYTIENRGTYWLTIAPEVDNFYWAKQGKSVQWIASTFSMGEAEIAATHLSDSESISLSHVHVECLCIRDWEWLTAQAKALYEILNGRSLLEPEICALLKKNNCEMTEKEAYRLIQYLYLHQYVTYLPAVTLQANVSKWRCNRCLATYTSITKIECLSCNEDCAMCENCYLLGRARRCNLLFQFKRRKTSSKHSVSPPILSLTPAQQQVADRVDNFMMSDIPDTVWLWAVTGAGKTEMLMPSVYKTLKQGGSVLWVTPRVDVVTEIAPRIAEFFPKCRCVALYKGSPDTWDKGDVVVCTAHQAIRFFRAFDLVIVDEVDAYPLYGNKSLEESIRRTVTCNGKMIFLTATPPKSFSPSKDGFFVLPMRYHLNPLPVPKVAREWFLEHKKVRKKRISTVIQFLERVYANDGQAFIFVSCIQDVQRVVMWLQSQGFRDGVGGVHGRSQDRKEKVEQFRNGMLRVLVTTTILERGVTVPRCWVLVWGADRAVFSKSSLIQISGRVGRSADYQVGEVWFLITNWTNSIKQAKKEIIWLNQHAQKEGLSKKEAYTP